MTVQVLEPGLFTTVQDLGRPGFQAYGVPVSGAMDPAALRIANLLVGNSEGAAGLEITLTGPRLRFSDARLLALGGADLSARVRDVEVEPWRAYAVPAGAELTFGAPRGGCRSFLAIAGGISVPEVLASRSTYTRAGIGGVRGRSLQAGDVLPLGAAGALSQRIGASCHALSRGVRVARIIPSGGLRPPYSAEATVRLMAGAHQPALTPESLVQLHSEVFRVSSQSDRMGFRLLGRTLQLREPLELLSEGTTFGTVQLPPDGNPVVLMADRQTTGGYPRIGEVASVDLSLLAQLKPGDRVRFRSCSLGEAQSSLVRREREIRQFSAAITFLHP